MNELNDTVSTIEKNRRKRLILNNTKEFAEYYLDFEINPLQIEIDKFVKGKYKTIILAPVGHGKTDYFSMIKILQLLCENKNTRILYGSKTMTLSQKNMKRVASIIESNEKLREDFGLEPDYDRGWNVSGYYLKRPNEELKDPSVFPCALHHTIEGTRGDVGILDDIIDINSMTSENERIKSKDWVDFTFIPRLDAPNERMYVIGTYWHFKDVYNYIQKKKRFDSRVFKSVNYETKKVLWPKRMSFKKLMEIKEDLGERAFELKYQNNIEILKGSFFKFDWLEPFHDFDKDTMHDMDIYQGWDLAISEMPGADWTVCVTIGVTKGHRQKQIYVLDVYREKMGFREQVDAVKALYSIWKPIKIIIESNVYQIALPQQLISESFLPIDTLKNSEDKPSSKGTLGRMIYLSPYFQNGTIKVREDMNSFINEYINFDGESGTHKHDDILDALYYACYSILYKPERIREFMAR